MCTIFWDNEGILMVDFKERNTVKYYAASLHELKDIVKEKCRGNLTKGILLLHDNVFNAVIFEHAIR